MPVCVCVSVSTLSFQSLNSQILSDVSELIAHPLEKSVWGEARAVGAALPLLRQLLPRQLWLLLLLAPLS